MLRSMVRIHLPVHTSDPDGQGAVCKTALVCSTHTLVSHNMRLCRNWYTGMVEDHVSREGRAGSSPARRTLGPVAQRIRASAF